MLRMRNCPLCHRSFPPEQLRRHIDAENQDIREYTMKFIKARHPEWVADNGACQRCWTTYKGMSKFVRVIRKVLPGGQAKPT
jgi:hypothetical protein